MGWVYNILDTTHKHIGTCDLQAVLVVIVTPTEHLSKAHRKPISHNPLLLLLGGLEDENETSQLTLHRSLTNSENVKDGQEIMAFITMNA
jgi:hypothetical protein